MNFLTINHKLISLFCLVTVLIFSIQSHRGQAASPTPPSRHQVCEIVNSMPMANNSDQFLALLKTDRYQVIKDLTALKSNMEQYDAEGYGWQNVIDRSSGLKPLPDAWLIGALRIACESNEVS